MNILCVVMEMFEMNIEFVVFFDIYLLSDSEVLEQFYRYFFLDFVEKYFFE